MYLQNSPSFHLTLKTPLGNVPSWVQTTFNFDKLIFWGKIPLDLKENINFNYYLQDTETKLTSDIMGFYFEKKLVQI